MNYGYLDGKVFCESQTGYIPYWIDTERIYENLDLDGDGEMNESAIIDSKVVEISCKLKEDVLARFEQQYWPAMFSQVGDSFEIVGLRASARVYPHPETTRLEIRRFAPVEANAAIPLTEYLPEKDLGELLSAAKMEGATGPFMMGGGKSMLLSLDSFFSDPFLGVGAYSIPSMTTISYLLSVGGFIQIDNMPFELEDDFAIDDKFDRVVFDGQRKLHDVDGASVSCNHGEVVLEKPDAGVAGEGPSYIIWFVNKTRGWEVKEDVQVGRGVKLEIPAIEGDRILVFGSAKKDGSGVFGARHYEVEPGCLVKRCEGDCENNAKRVVKEFFVGPADEAKEGTGTERKGFSLFSW